MARRRSAPRRSPSRSSTTQKSSYSTLPRQQQASNSAPKAAPGYNNAPPPATQQKPTGSGLLSGLAGTMMQGVALGTGSAIAHRAIDSAFSGSGSDDKSEIPQENYTTNQMQSEGVCQNQAKAFTDCMSDTNGNMEACRYYFDMLQQCKMGSTALN